MAVSLVLLFIVIMVQRSEVHRVVIDYEQVFLKEKSLPRFWTSTGLCPPAPREKAAEFLLSNDSLLNLEIIASLPNQGLKYVRIHWLLELLQFSLHECGLYPGFEFMGLPVGIHEREKNDRSGYFWADLTLQISSRYLHRYGIAYVSNWRFETWNEPDLKEYNVLNFTVADYITYIQSIRLGLDAAGRLLNLKRNLPLRGPAGLFKAEQHHPFCWTALELCNNAPLKCPFNVITFHRKGNGTRAEEIVNGGIQLSEQLVAKFPNLGDMKFSNDEADPIAGWSTPREFQSNVKYAAIMVSTVLQHWFGISDGRLPKLDSISHDNGFLSYHPFEFDQRTLLARFQMNETTPRHVQFVAKPVYSALGLLANLGSSATDTAFADGNLTYVVSYDKEPFYSCLLLSISNDTFEVAEKRSNLTVTLTLPENVSKLKIAYIIEGLQAGLNDPKLLWAHYGKPSYPNATEFAAIRSIQFPTVLEAPKQVPNGKKNLTINLNLRTPWVVSIRLCGASSSALTGVSNIRVRKIYTNEVMIFWSDRSLSHKCVAGYEIFFRSNQTEWMQINIGQHTPFMFYQFVSNNTVGTAGLYRVRTIDLFGKASAFSAAQYFDC
ncbi:alpha-L-iduronidase isoform X2 [Toxorhynchites rutilus septentrionalis]|uniref:alpha-L-iduronidase isoform X2 n=1 Tax=Toxorhynchites rutilus septentrionalis TaxID=329112 RepID=UPI00247AB23F|nr:alpha-L-iduronidase isoform X2 [Toxorhynchites rutilus septentrionalis]